MEGLFPTKGQDSNHLDSAVSHKLHHVNISSPTQKLCQKVKGGVKDEIKVTMDH